MRVALLGGIFGNPMHTFSTSPPEAVVKRFVEEAGHEIVPLSVHRLVPFGVPADLYHANHFGLAAYHLALTRAGPFVFTPHNPFLVSDFDETESRADHWLQQHVFDRADAVIVNAHREIDKLERRLRVDRRKTHVIPNGLDLAPYAPGPRARRDGLEVLAVGQLVEYKGHRYLLEAIARLAAEFPALTLRIVTHQRTIEEELLALAGSLGIGERLTIEGPLATPDLIDRLHACDVFMQPSLAECYPVTVVEAMAAGCAIVATDVGGVAEALGDAGVVIPARDAEATAEALRPLLASAGARDALGARALERARGQNDGRDVARKHIDVYQSVAGKRRRPDAVMRAAAWAMLAAYERKAAAAQLVPASLRRKTLT